MDYNKSKESGIYDPNDMWRTVKYHCDLNHVKVFNCTRGGELEVFPRAEFEDILEIKEAANYKDIR